MGRDLLFVFKFGSLYQIFMRVGLDYAELYGLIDICRPMAVYALEEKL